QRARVRATARTTGAGDNRALSWAILPLGPLRQSVCLSRRFRNSVACPAGQGEAHGFGKTDFLLAYCASVANSPITRCRPDTTRAMRLKSTLSGVSVARW